MKTILYKLNVILLATAALFLTACDDDEKDGSGNKYVILSAGGKWDPGYITTYGEMPSGNVTKITDQTLQTTDAFGIRSFGKWLFIRANAAGDPGLQKFSVNADGSLKDEGFIPSASQFLVVDENNGYYLDENRSTLKIQTFDPSKMERTGEIDLTSLKKDGIEYQVIGKHTLAAKEGKLYAGITYGTITGQGFGDDVVDYVEFAVIDMSTKTLEKTIKYDGLPAIGWGSSGNKMWTLGDDGGLYLFSPGLGKGFNTSAVIRIKAGETDFDKNWIVRATDYNGPSSISNGRVKNGKLYIELASVPMPNDFSNLESIIFDYYAIDLVTKQATKITGMPQHHYVWANEQGITEIDNKLYFWVRNPGENIDAYYVLNSDGVSATQQFTLDHQGFMWGFVKLD